MINSQTSQQLLFRDGSGKQDQELKFLDPESVQVENRNIEEIISEAQKIAKQLLYFNDRNEAVSTWEPFLSEMSEKTSFTEEERAESWARKLSTYLEEPERFRDDQKTLTRLSQPHTVLFLTFLKLIGYIKEQINGLTRRHLDYYLFERLKLKPEASQPDVVNILIELADNASQLMIEKDTVFLAGQDEEGNELRYATSENTIINKGKIDRLRSVFVDKAFITIEELHTRYADNPDDTLTAMFELAVGEEQEDYNLSAFPAEIQDIHELYLAVAQSDEEASHYVSTQLYLDLSNFNFIFELHHSVEQPREDWLKVYDLLKKAHQEKLKTKRRDLLKNIREAGSFYTLLRHVYGTPEPGNSMPFYKGKELSFQALNDDLKGEEFQKVTATLFIEEELRLQVQDFLFLYELYDSDSENAEDWDKAYYLLELADRQTRKIVFADPSSEKILNIYASENTSDLTYRRYQDEAESLRFRTFGNYPDKSSDLLETTALGYGIASPLLSLKEGKRTITLLQNLFLTERQYEVFEDLIHKDIFRILLTNEEGLFEAQQIRFDSGTVVMNKPFSQVVISKIEVVDETDLTFDLYLQQPVENEFVPLLQDSYVIDDKLSIYRILSINTPEHLTVKKVGKPLISQDGAVSSGIYSSRDIYLQSFTIEIMLGANDQAVVPANEPIHDISQSTELPALVVRLDSDKASALATTSEFEVFEIVMAAKIEKTHLKVEVAGLKGMVIQNDQGSLNPKKPYEPFGFQPEVGSNFYFTHEEIAEKVISGLQIEMDWTNLPKDFSDYYQGYFSEEQGDEILINSNEDFKVNLFLQEDFNEIPIATGLSLFPDENKLKVEEVVDRINETTPDYHYGEVTETSQSPNEITDWRRYFKLELSPIDFQHDRYNSLQFQQSTRIAEEGTTGLNPPYVPKLRNMSISYEAETEIYPGGKGVYRDEQLFEIHPFGYKEAAISPSIFPLYQENGSLYIEIGEVEPGQTINILFQMAEGSSDPDVKKPDLKWSYLQNNVWHPFRATDLIADRTNGLQSTGLVTLRVPKEANRGNTLLANSGYHIKISVANQIEGISEIIAIKSQVLSATLISDSVAASHFLSPLRPESIKDTEEFFPEISALSQPYTSRGGKPTEDGELFYRRISERLRHKNRALTFWDYERMVLEAFPEIFKVKCLPDTAAPGNVIVTVVPDIREKLPFDPFAPKVSSEVLSAIGIFLTNRAPVHT
ncbi:MAG: baseplate J/gp47 family protein, partial [Cyclobacteriaceae bacterium]